MPRQSRINAPGALHHIIARGIGRRKIFDNDGDRDDFLECLGTDITVGYWGRIQHLNFRLLLGGLILCY